MSIKLQTLIPLATTLFLVGCGGGGGDSSPSSNTNPTTPTTVSFSGVAVDGYISGATACIDLNSNGSCDSSEPTAPTASDGTFSFTDVEVQKDTYYPIIISGGVDTATGKAFTGELKNIIDSKTITPSTNLNVTPLTDLVATSFMASPTKTTATLTQAKTDVATSLSLSEADVNSDPMKDKKLFAKTQEVQQLKELLLTASKKATSTTDTQSLTKNITLAIVKSMQESGKTLDTTKAISSLESIDNAIVIPNNEKEFIQKQTQEVKSSLQKMVNDDTIDTTALATQQSNLEDKVEVASNNLKEATNGTTITVVQTTPSDVTPPVDTTPVVQNPPVHTEPVDTTPVQTPTDVTPVQTEPVVQTPTDVTPPVHTEPADTTPVVQNPPTTPNL